MGFLSKEDADTLFRLDGVARVVTVWRGHDDDVKAIVSSCGNHLVLESGLSFRLHGRGMFYEVLGDHDVALLFADEDSGYAEVYGRRLEDSMRHCRVKVDRTKLGKSAGTKTEFEEGVIRYLIAYLGLMDAI